MVKDNGAIKDLKYVTILGYSGSYLSLLFEYLHSIKFGGKVKIISNETKKRAPAQFATGIPFEIVHYSKLTSTPAKNFIFCSNKPNTKKFLYDFYRMRWSIDKQDFLKVVDDTSVIASTVSAEQGLQIREQAGIGPFVKLGFGVNIGRNCSLGHHNILGDFCSVNLGTNTAGHVEIGSGTTVGPGCTVFNHVKIGNNTIIGGGSVVTKDIPSNVLAYGNPCRIIKKLI